MYPGVRMQGSTGITKLPGGWYRDTMARNTGLRVELSRQPWECLLRLRLRMWHHRLPSGASWKTQSRVFFKMPGVSRTQPFPWVSGCLFSSQPGKYITTSSQNRKTPNLITKEPSLEFAFHLQNVASSFKEGAHQKRRKKKG